MTTPATVRVTARRASVIISHPSTTAVVMDGWTITRVVRYCATASEVVFVGEGLRRDVTLRRVLRGRPVLPSSEAPPPLELEVAAVSIQMETTVLELEVRG